MFNIRKIENAIIVGHEGADNRYVEMSFGLDVTEAVLRTYLEQQATTLSGRLVDRAIDTSFNLINNEQPV